MSDLKSITKRRIIKDMVQTVQPTGGWKVLIVDNDSMRIISAACRMFDIMEEGVTLVEKIDVQRDAIPSLEAIYFLAPTPESIDLLIKDFANPKEPQYLHAHLFLTAKLSDDLFGKIKAAKHLVSRVKTLKEFNLDYLAYESQVFHFDSPQSFNLFFSPDSTGGPKEQRRIADKLLSVCATLKEYPIVRYATGTVAASMASIVQDKLDELKKISPEFSAAARETTNRSTLLILDRSYDVITPILHEFTYQAMIYDLLPVQNDHYKYTSQTNDGSTKEKEVILSEVDPLWPTLRHKHIADTMNWILDGFNEFIKENKATKLYSGKRVDNLKEMSEAMKAMPLYKEMLDKYSLHINMSTAAMKVFEDQQLKKIAYLEQDMATGEDAEGNPVKNVISAMPPILTDETISKLDKIRLLMIYIISQEGIKDGDRKRLMELAKVTPEEQSCISNLRYIGVTLLKGAQAKKKQKLTDKKKKKQRDDAPPYELSRYVPSIKKLGEDIIGGQLDGTEFPAVREDFTVTKSGAVDQSKPTTSLRKSLQPKWADKSSRKSDREPAKTGGRIIIFIAGGATLSEMRAVYELSTKYNREVILGSTALLKPSDFVQELAKLKKPEIIEGGVELP